MVRTDGTTDRTTSKRGKTTESAAAHADRGFTLIEILIAIVLISGGVLAVLQAWRFSIESSDRHRSQADVQNVLTSAAERIMDPAFTAPACTPDNSVPTNQAAIATAYQTEARKASLPLGWNTNTITVATNGVQYWNGADTGTIWGATCYQANGLHLTQVTISVRSPDGKASGTLQVVKSDV